MGRTIVFLFFLIGFGIFVLLKHASAGLKAGYEAASRNSEGVVQSFASFRDAVSHDEERLVNSHRIIYGLLSSQLALASVPVGAVPLHSRAADEYSIGYICGFVDCFTAKVKLRKIEFSYLLRTIFIRIFGNDGAAIIAAKLSSGMYDGSKSFASGFDMGADDSRGYAEEGGARIPSGLFSHLV